MRIAIILVGGLGTRLRPIVSAVPKPMAPVREEPFLAILLRRLIEKGFSEAVLAVGYKKEEIVSYFGGEYRGLRIRYSVEHYPLGTGGATRKALKLMDSSPVFVMNGDTLQDFEPQEMEMRFQKSKAPVILVRKLAGHGKRYGGVVLGERRVSEFGSDAVTSEYINSGVYLLPRDEFDGYDAEAFSLEEDYFPHSVKSKQYEWVVDEGCNFVDIGVPEDYVSLRNRLESKQTDL